MSCERSRGHSRQERTTLRILATHSCAENALCLQRIRVLGVLRLESRGLPSTTCTIMLKTFNLGVVVLPAASTRTRCRMIGAAATRNITRRPQRTTSCCTRPSRRRSRHASASPAGDDGRETQKPLGRRRLGFGSSNERCCAHMPRQGVPGPTAASDDGASTGEPRQRRGRRQVSTPKSLPASVDGRFERAERASAATTSALLMAAAKRWVQTG